MRSNKKEPITDRNIVRKRIYEQENLEKKTKTKSIQTIFTSFQDETATHFTKFRAGQTVRVCPIFHPVSGANFFSFFHLPAQR